ncbi:MAG: cyclase family protein [Actinobacteria bacterium]|nr:MAG: cyclase family protein [Actinomycetota bacterium]
MADELLALVSRGVRVFDLGRELFNGMPQSPNHPRFWMALQRRHGDVVRPDGGSAASETITTGGHVGTHIDALSHVSHDGALFGGLDAAGALSGGRFASLGIDTVSPMVCRGVLLDIPRALGVELCEPAYEITPDDLDAACERSGVRPGPADVVLVRSGWGKHWDDPDAYLGRESGVPGVAEEGAKWIASMGVRAAGADTIAFEQISPGEGHSVLPAHRVLIVEHGIHIIETLALEDLAAAGVAEFTFVVTPLKIVGATGSPVRPIAVVPA